VFSGGSVQLAESLEQKSLLLVVGMGQALDDLSGMRGTSLDALVRCRLKGSTVLVLRDGSGLVVGFVSNFEVVNLSEGLLALRLSLLSNEAELRTVGGLVVESGQVQWAVVEAFLSRFGSFLLDLEGRGVLGQ